MLQILIYCFVNKNSSLFGMIMGTLVFKGLTKNKIIFWIEWVIYITQIRSAALQTDKKLKRLGTYYNHKPIFCLLFKWTEKSILESTALLVGLLVITLCTQATEFTWQSISLISFHAHCFFVCLLSPLNGVERVSTICSVSFSSWVCSILISCLHVSTDNEL